MDSGGSGQNGENVPNNVEDLRPGSGFVILQNNKMEDAPVLEIKLMKELVTRLLVSCIKVMFNIVLTICFFLFSSVFDKVVRI